MKVKPPVKPVSVPARGFRYLLDPKAEVAGRSDPQPCAGCAEERPGFVLVVIHENGYWTGTMSASHAGEQADWQSEDGG